MTSTERHVVMISRPNTLPAEIMVRRLRTVEDVVSFFKAFEPPLPGTRLPSGSVAGKVPPFKFVYCARLDTGVEFRPYDVVVVPRDEQPAEHFVVSHNAVVHVRPGGQPPEVTLVADWIRETKQFDALRKLLFFRQYLLRKWLTRWRANIVYTQYMQARTRLGKKLFLSKNTFAEATIVLRKLAFDCRCVQQSGLGGKIPSSNAKQNASEHIPVETALRQNIFPMRLFYYPDQRPALGYTAEQFLEIQRAHFSKVAQSIARTVERVKQVMMSVVEVVSERAIVPDVSTMEQLEQFIGIASNVKGSMGALYRQEREAERQQRKRELKQRMVEYDLLVPWMRLVDTMITTELYINLQNSIDTFAKHLDLPKLALQRELRISFQVGVVFKGDEPLRFVPSCESVQDLIAQLIGETVDKVSAFIRVIDMKELRVHSFKQPMAQTLSALVRDSAPFQASNLKLRAICERDFSEAHEKSRAFEPCRQWLLFLSSEWPQEYATWAARASEKAKDKCLEESEIRKYIGKVGPQGKARSDLQKMSNKNSGVLSINIDPLVADLSNRLGPWTTVGQQQQQQQQQQPSQAANSGEQGVLVDIKSTLLALASRRCHDVAKELEANIALLKHPNLELREFADWVERCNQVEEASRALLQECNDVDALYVIAEDNLFDFPQLHRDKRDRTVGAGKGGELPLRMQLTEALAAARTHKEKHLEEIRQQLEIAVTDTVGVLEAMTDELRHGEYREATHSSASILSKLQGAANTLQSLKLKRDTLNQYTKLLSGRVVDWHQMAAATETYDMRFDLWSTVARWEERRAFWNRTPVSQLSGEKIKEEMTEMYQKAHKLNKSDPDSVTDRLLNAITVEKVNLPVMVELCNPALKEEHWIHIFDGIGKRPQTAENRTLETLRTFGAYQYQDLINGISAVATGEFSLLNQVNKIAQIWDTTELPLAKNKGNENCMVLGGLEEILLQLEDHQVQIQTCLASRYVSGIRPLVEGWDTKLQTISDVLDEWVQVQKAWMYLEFIFSSDDIKKQLAEESRMFAMVDKTFRTLMTNTVANNNAATVCSQDGLLESLQRCTESLDKIQKRLEDYLETKRVAFPRFYFLSNDELLSILSDVRNPEAVQPHLQKCFDNIKELQFDSGTVISAMKSQEGEVVPFTEKLRIMGNVENWLSDVERTMRRTLQDLMGRCVAAYPLKPRTEWYFDFCAQCIGCVDMIYWTSEVEGVFQKIADGQEDALTAYHANYRKEILQTVELVKGKLSKNERTCVCTLIVVDVHNRDVVQYLIDEKCRTAGDFNWQKQLRYYWKEVDGVATSAPTFDCHIHHSAAKVMYGYEYLGAQLRLVITPLTERAFLTCTSALHIYLGAAPQGPAGTGKTESVKDLGKALARQVVVFNCSDGLNYKMMSQMFAGLAQAGAWACFDEFNRIEIEVLSVVAQQMLEITTAIARKQTAMKFDGHTIRLHKNFGVFITMNPGYAGRTELPDNLKALFRPICMMIPDYALIAEIMFYSEGFADAKTLAQKMVRLYSLASQQLSKQDHYDFGMRAVKSILVMAGALKRAEPDNAEEMILIRAMRDSNVPKFLRDDTVLFMALIRDLFPAVDIKEVINKDLQAELEATLLRNGLQVVPLFVDKIVQLYETMVVRHGVMLVGQTMTGKSANAQTLSAALTQLKANGIEAQQDAHKRFFHTTHTHTLNPKSITMGEMYGDINAITREWQDGILSNIVRDLVRRTTPDRNWICFDGPVDAIWIENMNTVLDDNKLLCLVNGERIKIPETITILFEVQDLKVASPATVSRCGMVFMEPYYLDGGWKPVAKSYSERVAKSTNTTLTSRWRHERLLELLGKAIPATLEHYRKHLHEYIGTVDLQLVLCLLDLLQAMVANRDTDDDGDDVETAAGKAKVKPPKATMQDDRKLFDMQFVMAYIWTVGGNVSDKARDNFSTFASKLISQTLYLPFPDTGSIYDYFVHRGSLTWLPWSYRVPSFQYDPALPYFDLLVPTTDTIILRQLLLTASSIGKHVLVSGVTGTGKSVAVANFLTQTLKTEDAASHFVSFSMTFSAQTSSQNFQETLESKLVRRRGDRELGPAPGKRFVFVVDDCNMPQLEQYGASPPVELLRQIISQGGCYDRKKLAFKEISDITFFACCGEPGGGKNELTMRLTSRFLCLCIPAVSQASMTTIFNGILGGYLATNNFVQGARDLTASVVAATIEIYERIAVEMLPTPEKTHYTFNLRDVSKVVQGVLQLRANRVSNGEGLIKGWVHECSRVFHDRLINATDREWWYRCIGETIQKHFPGIDAVNKVAPATWVAQLYGSWADKKSTDYKEIGEPKAMQDLLREFQLDFNATRMRGDQDLVLFDDAIGHLARICRILRQPRGNALLVGVGGSGRHSLCELAAHMCGMDCRGIVIVRGYGVNEFREDVKKVLLDCGVKQKPIAFMVSDTQIVYNQFLEDINSLLNIGEVPGLMGPEEWDQIMQGTRAAVQAAGKPETRGAMYQFFVSRCRENLHVIVFMSPVGAAFRDRLRMFPSLVNCMAIDWFTAWPRDALLSVAARQLQKMDLGGNAIRTGVFDMCVHMHMTVKSKSAEMMTVLKRRSDTTPTSYLSLLSSYQEMYTEQEKTLADQFKRYKNGIDKLNSTNTVIEQLKEKIRQMQPVLATASKDAEKQAQQLVVEQAEADKVKAEVSSEEIAARILMDEAEAVKEECQAGLNEALPALHNAQKALNTLQKKDIDEVKSFPTPPTNVEKTMDAVCILLKEKEGWAASKAVLSQMGFLSRLQEYPKDDIAPLTIRKLQKYVTDKEFTPEIVEKTSLACKSLCLWVLAINKYYHVSREIAPKREKLKEAETKVAKAKEDLAIKQERLNNVVAKIDKLQRQAKETAERKASLEKQIVDAEAKLSRADQLIGGLSSEKQRWEMLLEQLRVQRKNVVGTMLLAAGCVAYVGPFPSDFRQAIVVDWTAKCKSLGIPVDDGFSLDTLPDQYTVREWTLQSLPSDPFSIENATILQRSKRWCLMIDPQGQANQFIRRKEGPRKLRVIKMTDDNYMRTIESAIQVGHPVLLENVGETLDAQLNPILLKEVVKQGGRMVLRLGEKEVDYDPEFRFYITTKLPNPVFSPELQIKVTVVNFTVTRKGLEDQQLGDIVGFERADLQEKSDQCVVAIAEGKQKIKNLEDQILKMLAEASGDILDNIELIDTLSASKATATRISDDLAVVEATNAEIDVTREKYRRLATRGSFIYGVIADLANIDPMYQNSLQFFKKLFMSTIQRVPHEENETVERRMELLIPAVTQSSYSVICRGLFERDKLLFAFYLAVTFLQHEGGVKVEEWAWFLRGASGREPPAGFPPCPSGVSKNAWIDFAALVPLLSIPGLEGSITRTHSKQWAAWFTSETPQDDPIPGSSSDISEWHRLLLVKTFRHDKLIPSMARMVGATLGAEYQQSPQFSLKDAFADSNNMSPLIFVLSTGTDPTVLFTSFAHEMGYADKKLMLSLGQDQGKRAAEMIAEGRKEGLWVYLQNAHVYVSWMPTLERLVEQMRPEDTHADFRLWLTSNPSPEFPVPVLQSGMKLTREPPKGLRANLKDSIHSLDVEVWEEQSAVTGEDGTTATGAKERPWKKLVFALAFFHALVQERRKFGALGWNIPYEWSSPDMSASIKTLRIALSDFDSIPWTAIQYTIGVINYGGRVTDFLDNRCLQAIMMQFFTPELLGEGKTFDTGAGVYIAPEPCSKEDLLSFVEALPQWERPELFGLHANANITFQAKESNNIMASLISVAPRGGGGSGAMSADETVLALASSLLSRVPARIDVSKAHPSSVEVTADGTMISLGTVLLQEIDQFNRLLRRISSSLEELMRAIKGEVVMSAVMEKMHGSFLFNQIPANWASVGYLCLKPLASYFEDLRARVEFITSWCVVGAPKSFWLPGLFFPQGFVTGVFQTHSRKHRLPIDTLKFHFHPQRTEDVASLTPPPSGVYIHGFYLEGAGWDVQKACLQESRPGVLYTPLPPVRLEPVELKAAAADGLYECPLYKASTRAGTLSTTGLSTNFVLSMQLCRGAGFTEYHWTARGVAALCMLND